MCEYQCLIKPLANITTRSCKSKDYRRFPSKSSRRELALTRVSQQFTFRSPNRDRRSPITRTRYIPKELPRLPSREASVFNFLWSFAAPSRAFYHSDNRRGEILGIRPQTSVVTRSADKRAESLIFDLADYPTNPGW